MHILNMVVFHVDVTLESLRAFQNIIHNGINILFIDSICCT